jgi:hypothetical protein
LRETRDSISNIFCTFYLFLLLHVETALHFRFFFVPICNNVLVNILDLSSFTQVDAIVLELSLLSCTVK